MSASSSPLIPDELLSRAIRKVKAVSGRDELSMLGWCIGAILATAYAALRPDSGPLGYS